MRDAGSEAEDFVVLNNQRGIRQERKKSLTAEALMA